MKEIELSTMAPSGVLDLEGFTAQTNIRVRHRPFDWATAWTHILEIGMYQRGPELSEIGSTWLENLVDMRALRPFSNAELFRLGGNVAFLSSAWPNEVTRPGSPPRRVTGIPWTLDTRLVYYRRDLFARAGIAAADAFASPEAMTEALRRLQAAGIPYPLGLPTGGLAIHNLASWVWGRGGYFRTDDYHKIALVEPEARQGMLDYFSLHRFIDPASLGEDYTATNNRYGRGNTAVMLNGQWLMREIKERTPRCTAAVLDGTGYALTPGVPFVGASNLVIWQHSLYEQEAVQLIEHLTSLPVLARTFASCGNFPARAAALEAAPFAGDPDYQLVVDCFRRGRMFRTAHLWAGVETRVNALVDQLWADLFANPELDLPAEIETRTRDLAARLEKTILANW